MVRRGIKLTSLFCIIFFLIFFSGMSRKNYYIQEKKILVCYPEIPGNGKNEVINYYVNYMDTSISKLDYLSCSRFYVDLYLEENDLPRGHSISLEELIEIGKKAKADIVIYSRIKQYRANRWFKPGMTIIEPYTTNTTILNEVTIESDFIDVKNGKTLYTVNRGKSKKNRILGLFTLKKYLLHKTLRECIGETLYLAKRSEVI